jgi:succinyl-diaminopimelate desuccinylase
MGTPFERVLRAVDDARDELVELTRELVRIPSVNPPGEGYREIAQLLGDRLRSFGYEVSYHQASDRPEHTREHPRVNVLGRLHGRVARPLLHLNGHLDVVPPGAGWTRDPFAALVENGRIYGRGTADMKAGIAAAVFAVEALKRADVRLEGSIELSGTVDEESGGQAGVGWLCERGIVSSENTDFAIIPEPLNPDRICVGHRGVYWFKVVARGRIAHGSMPFLGSSAIDQIAHLVERIRTELQPRLRERITDMPVVPSGARQATLNVNSIRGGQAGLEPQTPCVADFCEAIFDRRFLLEEGFDRTRAEIAELIDRASSEDPERHYELTDLLVFHPVRAPEDSPLVDALGKSIEQVYDRKPDLVASPGTYDQKHFARIGGIEHCVAYGPGTLELAHQADEWVGIDDLVRATQVLALGVMRLVGSQSG